MWVDLKVVHKIHDKGHTCKCTIRLNLNLKSLLIVVVAVFVVAFVWLFFVAVYLQAGWRREGNSSRYRTQPRILTRMAFSCPLLPTG